LNAKGYWTPPKKAVKKAQTPHEYNLSLSEMRHMADDTMVLVLSQGEAPVEEAEYPIDIDEDTSELLEAEGLHNYD
jgi:hypothetical protein